VTVNGFENGKMKEKCTEED